MGFKFEVVLEGNPSRQEIARKNLMDLLKEDNGIYCTKDLANLYETVTSIVPSLFSRSFNTQYENEINALCELIATTCEFSPEKCTNGLYEITTKQIDQITEIIANSNKPIYAKTLTERIKAEAEKDLLKKNKI